MLYAVSLEHPKLPKGSRVLKVWAEDEEEARASADRLAQEIHNDGGWVCSGVRPLAPERD